MQEFKDLRERVEHTAHKLTNLHVERREQSQSLVGVLAELEAKYVAQEQQLAWYRDKVEPLEKTNADLAVLLENLLDLIDRGFGETSLEPIRGATALASTMLQGDMAPVIKPVETVPEPVAIDEEISLDALEKEVLDVAVEDEIILSEEETPEQTDELDAAKFVDVPEETLALEIVADDLIGSDDLPAMVSDALRASNDNDVPEELSVSDLMTDIEFSDLAAEVSAPEAESNALELIEDEDADLFVAPVSEETPVSGGPDKADIRALLERVQNLASKAEAMQEPTASPEQDGLDRIASAVNETREQTAAYG